MKVIKIDNKVLLAIFLVCVGYCLFYWYEFRPAKIKHDCSWTKVTEAAIQAINKEEVEASRVEYDKCIEDNNKRKEEADKSGSAWAKFNLLDFPCEQKLKYERPYTPEKEWYRKATEKEYNFCLHEKGL